MFCKKANTAQLSISNHFSVFMMIKNHVYCFVFCVVYRKPSYDIQTYLNKLELYITTRFKENMQLNTKFAIVGDFTLRIGNLDNSQPFFHENTGIVLS